MGVIDWNKADNITKEQVDQANKLKIEVQKLIISLSTASLVFSVSLLQVIPKSDSVVVNGTLIMGWILLVASIIGGILTLIFGSWEFGNRLMAKAGKCDEARKKKYGQTAEIYKAISHFFEHANIWGFIAAVIFIVIFAIGVFSQM